MEALKHLLDSDDDWIETVRRVLYPWLHPYLSLLGGYSVGHVGFDQYVYHFDEDEEAIEDELVAVGGERNPIACLKSLPDGRVSEGSWRFTHATDPTGLVEPGMQLHLTLFERDDDEPGRELYAHYEDDWMASPSGHLSGARFSPSKGVQLATELIDNHTFLVGIRK
ncbi:hypothetical protein SAMN04488691_103153 [Haloferax larsenii]|uniref:Uncharacterized protein n=1 Tax=Haloferax larsenii TaxID=302484 RepID=A0A1H7N070_HALLR|nr:hypothetical protein SAMN04488691_103153 [Haloferax larsenii]